MSQQDMAAAVGVTKLTQMNYELARRSPDTDYLEKAAQAGVDTVFVLAGIRSNTAAFATEPAPAPYAGIRPDVVRIAIETLCMWLEKNDLHLAPASMAEAVLALCDIANTPEQVLERAPAALRMLKLAA
jgi:transcriptional regulator with XRE-family HTH domain